MKDALYYRYWGKAQANAESGPAYLLITKHFHWH